MGPMEWFGFGLAVLSVAIGAYASVKPMKPKERSLWINASKVGAVIGALVIAYSFVAQRLPAGSSPIIAQSNTNSPGGINALGGVTVVHPNQDRRVTKTDEFIRTLHAVGPATVKLEHLSDRDAALLFAQLYHLLVAAAWTAEERAEVTTTPWDGVLVAVQDIRHPPPSAVELVKQLRKNDIASGLVPETNPNAFQGTAFIIRIGYRP